MNRQSPNLGCRFWSGSGRGSGLGSGLGSRERLRVESGSVDATRTCVRGRVSWGDSLRVAVLPVVFPSHPKFSGHLSSEGCVQALDSGLKMRISELSWRGI